MTTSSDHRHHQHFESTDWSVINRLEGPDGSQAMSVLCEKYWKPLYSWARSRTKDVHKAQDLTQGFFAHILAKNSLRQAAPDRGRFRSFLLTSLKNYIASEYVRENAQQRGGGWQAISLDFDDGERHFGLAVLDNMSPDRIFDRSWTLTVLDQVMRQLRSEFEQSKTVDRFDALQPALNSSAEDLDYSNIADRLQITEVAARQAASRLRKRYRELLKAEVSRTLVDPTDIDDELHRMFQSLRPEG